MINANRKGNFLCSIMTRFRKTFQWLDSVRIYFSYTRECIKNSNWRNSTSSVRKFSPVPDFFRIRNSPFCFHNPLCVSLQQKSVNGKKKTLQIRLSLSVGIISELNTDALSHEVGQPALCHKGFRKKLVKKFLKQRFRSSKLAAAD